MGTTRCKSKGVSMIEFALVLPLLLMLLFGLIDFSVLFYNQYIITYASREGARYGVVPRSGGYASPDSIEKHIETCCMPLLITFGSPPPPVITVTPSSKTPSVGDTLTVTIKYTYSTLLIESFYSDKKAPNILTGTTIMAYE